MNIEVIEVEIPFAGIEAIEVEVVTATLPGTGQPDIPATPTPPSNPRDGQPWLESGTFILSYWSAAENSWIVPAESSNFLLPPPDPDADYEALLDDEGTPVLDDLGSPVLYPI